MVVVISFLFSKHIAGIAIWPFIIVKNNTLKNDVVFINHERIHLKQQLELLILPFYLWYVLEFLVRWLQYRNFYLGYKNIGFEKEAYSNETNLNYLKHRKHWGFWRCLKK